MSWEAYLEPLRTVSDGSVILSIRGDRYATKGNWKATHAEEVYISKIFERPNYYADKDLTYEGKKLIISRCEDNFVMAHASGDMVILRKSNSCIVGGHCQDSNANGSNLSEAVNTVTSQLILVKY